MFSRKRVKDAADTKFSVEDIVDVYDLNVENDRVKEAGKTIATGEPVVMGITEVSLSRQSF
jgi:DNA-directed RNA polymerase subunit beta'